MNTQSGDLIELGTASVETKGTPVGMDDSQGGKYPWSGLSDE
ncbi:MAG: benenodin family lasso peptide [Bacillota bacterium]